MSVTTATIWVCSACGRLSHLEGTVQPNLSNEECRGTPSMKHTLKPVLVVVPYA